MIQEIKTHIPTLKTKILKSLHQPLLSTIHFLHLRQLHPRQLQLRARFSLFTENKKSSCSLQKPLLQKKAGAYAPAFFCNRGFCNEQEDFLFSVNKLNLARNCSCRGCS